MSKPFSEVHIFWLRCQWHEVALYSQPGILFPKKEFRWFSVILTITVGGTILGAGAQS